MKKTAVITLILFVLSAFTAYADNYTELFGYTELLPKRGSVSADVTLESLKELEFLTRFKDAARPFDIKSITESLLNSKIHIDVNYRTQQNRKIARIYAKAYADAPVLLNEDLKINANAVFHIWADCNFTRKNSPYYRILIKSPLNGKYYMLESTAEDAVKIYPSERRVQKLKYAFEDALRGNSSILENDGVYTLSLTDSDFKGTLKALTDQSYNALYLFFNGSDSDRTNYIGYMNELRSAVKRLEPIRILGKGGIKTSLKINKDNQLEKASYEFNINTNIFKLYYASTGKEMPADPNAEKPVVNADNSDVALKIGVDAHYKTSYTDFKSPSPREEEIIDVYRDKQYSVTYTTNDTYVSPYEILSFRYDGVMKSLGGVPYIPLRAMLNTLGVPDENITWNESGTTVKGNAFVPFADLKFSENSPDVLVDGVTVTLGHDIISEDGTAYVPEDFVKKVIDAKLLDCTTAYYGDFNRYCTVVRIERIKPIYHNVVADVPLP